MHSELLLRFLYRKKLLSICRAYSKIFRKVLKESLGVRNEELILISDLGSSGHSVAPLLCGVYYLAGRLEGLKVNVVLQTVKDNTIQASDAVIQSLKNIHKKSIIVLLCSNRIGKLGPLGKSLRRYIKEKECKFISTSGVGTLKTSDFLSIAKAHDLNYQKMQKFGKKLKSLMDSTREVRIISSSGTDVKFNIQRQSAISIDGNYKMFRKGGNLPPGEVYIAPNIGQVEGKIVIDGAIRHRYGTLLLRKPVTLSIRKGIVTDIIGGRSARILKQTIKWAQARSKKPSNVRMIGELGIGFNPKIDLIGAMVIDEKALGTAHVALGSNYWFGGDVYSVSHLDQVFKNPIILFDGKEFKLPKKRDLL